MGHSGGRRRSRGAVAVEAALVTPVLLLLVFGIIEMAMLMKDNVALTSAVRAGGRTASTDAGAGPGDEGSDCVQPCSPQNAPMLAELAANAIARAGTALPRNSIDELWVYKANNKGYPGADGNTSFSSCTTNCVEYKWNPTYANSDGSLGQFRYYSGTWPSASINACANHPPDAVGVYMKATHQFFTGIFSKSVDISDHAVFAFEPLPNDSCGPSAPQPHL